MSQHKSTIEELYAAVMEAKEGVSYSKIREKYHIDRVTVIHMIHRYDKYGIAGLEYKQASHYSEQTILSAVAEYETKGLSLKDLSLKYDVRIDTLRNWMKKYERYKAGDKFAFSGGKIYKADEQETRQQIKYKPIAMPETEERVARRAALSKMTKKELYELLLDREAELEMIKKVEALVQKRESRLRATGRKSSKN
jgi:transposase